MLTKQILSLAVAVGLCGLVAPAAGPKPSGVITTVGEYKLFDGKLTVKAFEEKGKLTLAATRFLKDKQSVGHSIPAFVDKEAFWLIYPETSDKVWYFTYPHLVFWDVTNPNAGKFVQFVGKDAAKNAPKAVLEALPKEVLERLKSK